MRRVVLGVMVIFAAAACAPRDAAPVAAASSDGPVAAAGDAEAEGEGGMSQEAKVAAAVAGGVAAGVLLYFLIIGLGAVAAMGAMSGPS
jgi:hypothetical protein